MVKKIKSKIEFVLPEEQMKLVKEFLDKHNISFSTKNKNFSNTPDKKEGIILKNLRTASGISLEYVQKVTGINRGTLSNIESGKKGCSKTMFNFLSFFYKKNEEFRKEMRSVKESMFSENNDSEKGRLLEKTKVS